MNCKLVRRMGADWRVINDVRPCENSGIVGVVVVVVVVAVRTNACTWTTCGMWVSESAVAERGRNLCGLDLGDLG